MTGRILFLLLWPFWAFSQQDSIALDEVVVPDRSLALVRETSSAVVISDSAVVRNGSSLTHLLRNAPVYFKENGLGMVSTPSFRGTTAQHTAVIWNGINVNSPFLGLVDFNATGVRDFDRVTVRGGASSTTHGSSAIGGSVHLENTPRFGDPLKVLVHGSYGSFNTSAAHFRMRQGGERFAISASATHHYSDNDYELPSGRRNQNGRFQNTGISSVAAWRPNPRNTFTYYGYSYNADRRFSLLFPTDPKTRYRDVSLRNMAEWNGRFGWFHPQIKVAHLSEEYRFIEGALSGGEAWGRATGWVTRADAGLQISSKIRVDIIAENHATSAHGTNIGHRDRNVFAISALLKHEVSGRIVYNLSLRQEMASDYQSPVLFAGSGRIRLFGDHYLRAGFAKAFRAPTLNDLYWGTGGNPNLQPELSHQAEAGYQFRNRSTELQGTFFGNRISQMIRWLPESGNQWLPVNENRVVAYGFEATATHNMQWGRHRFLANGHYAWTVSQNDEGNQLIYVPAHKAGVTAEWNFGRISAEAGHQFTGPVHTRSDNDPRYRLDGYGVTDARLRCRIGHYTLGAGVQNLFDVRYQAVERRYFPGRNYTIEFTFKP